MAKEENVRAKWAQVQNQYQRRADLVPQLVATVQGGAAQELAIFKALRDQAASLKGSKADIPTGVEGQKTIEQYQAFDKALANVIVYVASNPQIQSGALFSNLMVQLEGTENRVAIARKDYSDAVSSYRLEVRDLPNSLFAGLLGFNPDKFAYFTASEGAQTAPVVVFPTPVSK